MSHRPSVSIVSVGLLAVSLTLHAAGCGLSDEKLYSTAGVCPPGADDRNPCTLDGCARGGASFTHEVLPDGTECTLGENAGACQAGLCVLVCAGAPSACRCSDPRTDCPAPTACLEWLCQDTHCQPSPRPVPVLPAEQQITGDCRKIVCTASGDTMSAPDDDDRPADLDECTIGVCIHGAPAPMALAEGAPCAGGQGGVCDSARSCVPCVIGTNEGCLQDELCYHGDGGAPTCAPASCFNATKDGDETDQDCGGKCRPCDLGSICLKNEDCGNQICSPSLASGGSVCCEVLCTGTCKSCVPGTGKCDDVPTGTFVPACFQQSKVCAKGVGCASVAGSACVSGDDCISGDCNSVHLCAPGNKHAPCVSVDDCVSGTVCNGATLMCQ
jgi:hypothetical protein